MQPIIIKNHLIALYPLLTDYLSDLHVIQGLETKDISVLDAISKIVIGQMLSRKAASTIVHRAESLAAKEGKCEIALLSEGEMRSCGISGSKAKAIKLFAEQYFNDVDGYENWRNLDSDRLFYEVNKHWGLSHWTASMLAIFYFGFEDVYPINDGSIKRATNLLEQKGITFEPEKAAPYRSYLALYLWEMLDRQLINCK
jgi:DNA-3-methyladenine glycosylase II